MCTVSWLREPNGYRVWFNRDERHERAPALPPSVHAGQIPWLAALDPEGGGTWLAVNRRGLTVALLNHYPAQAPTTAGMRSRGLLVADLVARTDSVKAVAQSLASHTLTVYRAFHLLALDENIHLMWTWDGEILQELNPVAIVPPITTSSFASADVVAFRQAVFSALPLPRDAAGHARFHRYTEPLRPAYGVVMDRDDARTVGLAEVTVAAGRIEYAWTPRMPGASGWGARHGVALDRCIP